jgi:tetratricopeptide (TPR) repeat protein
MSTALLVEFYNQLPQRLVRSPGLTPEGLPGEERQEGSGKAASTYPGGKARWRAALEGFKQQAAQRYNEGTLLRLLANPDARARRAAVFALGVLGTMEANAALAARLHDDDPEVPALAAEAMWSLWLRADSPASNDELHKLARLRDREKALAGLDRLVARAPAFAEAYNQRAIVLFRSRQYDRAARDCQKAIQLNPYHFGAHAGLGQCYLQLRRHKSALRAFRNALRINPHLEAVAEVVRTLEKRQEGS